MHDIPSSLIVSMCVHVTSYYRGEESIWCVSIHFLWWGQYVLDMYYIFSQHSPSFRDIGGRMSPDLRSLTIHLTKVSLDKTLVRMSTILPLILRSKWCLGSSVPCVYGVCTYHHRRTVVFKNVNTILWRSHDFQYPHCVETDWSDTVDKGVKFRLCCG
jgi:hypothetical protein